MLSEQESRVLDHILATIKTFSEHPSPRTQSHQVSISDFTFSNVYVKDESTNETGTHKDRMAEKILTLYKSVLESKQNDTYHDPLPHFSIISSGSAAIAIQTKLNEYDLPSLKVLIDDSTPQDIVEAMKDLGCSLFKTNLSKEAFTSKDILNFTNNKNGIDITSNEGLATPIHFYDDLSIEILDMQPDFILTPYGTGQLYENIHRVMKQLAQENLNSTDKDAFRNIQNCTLWGATSLDSQTKATKLYAPFRPFTSQSMDSNLEDSAKGNGSVYHVDEAFIQQGHEMLTQLGFQSEYSAGAGMGLLYQMEMQIPQDSKILIVNTGKTKIPQLQTTE